MLRNLMLFSLVIMFGGRISVSFELPLPASMNASNGKLRIRHEISKSLWLFSGGDFAAQSFLLFPGLGRKVLAEIGCLKKRTDLQLRIAGHGIRAALHPLDRLFHRAHLPDPVSRHQFLGLGKRSVDDSPLAT